MVDFRDWTNSQQVEKQESEGKISLIDAKLYYGHPLPILSDTRKFLHESFQKVIVRKELLLGHGGIFHVDRFRVVAEGRCLAENDERANDRCYSEDPQEKSVENHRYETPILIFLSNGRSKFK